MAKKKNLLPAEFDERKAAPVTSVEYRAELLWQDGMPYLASAPVRVSNNPQEALPELLRKVLDLPYDGSDSTLAGLSNAEAIAVQVARSAANGDLNATQMLFDRLLGRPKQSIETVSLTGDLNTFLDQVAEATKIETIEVEADVVPFDSAEDL